MLLTAYRSLHKSFYVKLSKQKCIYTFVSTKVPTQCINAKAQRKRLREVPQSEKKKNVSKRLASSNRAAALSKLRTIKVNRSLNGHLYRKRFFIKRPQTAKRTRNRSEPARAHMQEPAEVGAAFNLRPQNHAKRKAQAWVSFSRRLMKKTWRAIVSDVRWTVATPT